LETDTEYVCETPPLLAVMVSEKLLGPLGLFEHADNPTSNTIAPATPSQMRRRRKSGKSEKRSIAIATRTIRRGATGGTRWALGGTAAVCMTLNVICVPGMPEPGEGVQVADEMDGLQLTLTVGVNPVDAAIVPVKLPLPFVSVREDGREVREKSQPVPVSCVVIATPLEVAVSVPVTGPEEAGVKVTLIVQLAPPARVWPLPVGQLSVSPKPALTAIEMDMAVAPVFVRVAG